MVVRTERHVQLVAVIPVRALSHANSK